MVRVGLVLGAGGIVGQAYHAGVLAALEHDLGWDPRSADVVVGTSAGSVSGTLLRLGVPAHDLAARAVEAPLSVESAPLRPWLDAPRPRFPPFDVSHWLRRWRPPPRDLLVRIAKRPWAIRPSVLATAMMPAGRVDLERHTGALDDVSEAAWPDGLWVCATRRSDGGRTVFGRTGAPAVTLSAAVAASCAIPGYFAPIALDDVEYVDGGVHSPTNADVLVGERLDVVLVVAPMSAAGGLPRTVDGGIRYAVHRRLEREVVALRRRGTTVVRIEPTAETLEMMGVNMMAPDRADPVVQSAFVEAGRYAATPRIARRLLPLTTRSGRLRAGA